MSDIFFEQVNPESGASQNFIELASKIISLAGSNPQIVALPGHYDPAFVDVVDYLPIPVENPEEAASICGYGSMLHMQHVASFANTGTAIPTYLFPVPEPIGGTESVWTMTFSGSATSTGTITRYFGGIKISVVVTKGDTDEIVAQAFKDALDATLGIPFDTTILTNVLTLTTKWKGDSSNGVIITGPITPDEEKDEPVGISVVTIQTTPGAGLPDVTDIFVDPSDLSERLGDTWYTIFSNPFDDNDNLDAYSDAADIRASAEVKKPFGTITGYTDPAKIGTKALIKTLAEGINHRFHCIIPEERVISPPFVLSAALTGLIAKEANQEPGRPFKNSELKGVSFYYDKNKDYNYYDDIFTKHGSSYLKVTGNQSKSSLITGDIALTLRKTVTGADTREWFDFVALTRRQAKIYTLDQIFLSNPYIKGVAVDDSSITKKPFAVKPKDVKSVVTQLVQQVWGPQGWSKNIDDVVINTELAFNGQGISCEIFDDEAQALRITANKLTFLI